MTNASSSAVWRQLAGQKTPPSLAAAQQPLEHAERVLAEPQHPVAGAEARRSQRVGEPVHPVVELGPGEPDVAVDHGDALGIAPPVLAEDVAERQGVEQVDGSSVAMRRSLPRQAAILTWTSGFTPCSDLAA